MSHPVHRADAAHASHRNVHAQAATSRGHEHVVRPGDELERLASHYGVPPSSIVAANSHLIVDPQRPLVVGDNLRIPASGAQSAVPHATAAKAVPEHARYREVVTLPRAGHAPSPSNRLTEIVDHLNGYMRPHHPDLGNRNRIVHVRGPDIGKEIAFPLKHGAGGSHVTPMLDGNGAKRGVVLSDAVKINYGQRKDIAPEGGKREPYVYVIGPKIRSTAGHEYNASGWIPLSALKDSPARRHYRTDLAASIRHGEHGGDAPQHYTLDAAGAQRAKYGDLKVNPGPHGEGVPRDQRLAAGDYLLRPGGAVNLLYSLPGHGGASTDTFKAQRGVVDPSSGASRVVETEFVPSAGVPRARIPLYLPKDATAAERADWRNGASPHTMDFVYGRIGDRYGWIAADALKAA